MIVEKTFVKVINSDSSIALADFFDAARIETLQTIQTDAAITPTGRPELPTEGTVQKGMYNYNGRVVFCQIKHERTIYDPEQTPNLFTTFRDNSDDLQWIPNEKVETGWKRWYDGVQYEVIQAHMTLETWTPPATPALWNAIIEEPVGSEWTVGVAYAIGDIVTYNGAEYECRQSHTSQAEWTPPAVLALWLPL